MPTNPTEHSFAVELVPGQKLELPPKLVDSIGPGHWLVTITPADQTATLPPRGHTAFLNSYAPEDEGLYDDCAAR